MITVVTGGTTGLGRAVALARIARGDRVIAVGRDPERGARFLAEAERMGGRGRAHFIAADLSRVDETRRVIADLRTMVDRIDALVMGARHFRSVRSVTGEGFEYTFAHLYLSRFVMSHEAMDLLAAARAPTIVNLAGPGTGADQIRWDDLQAESGYDGSAALAQAGQLNDLLALGFTRRHPGAPVSYVLVHPGVVDTALSGDYDESDAAAVAQMRHVAQPVDSAVLPVLDVLDNRPTTPLSALSSGAWLDVDGWDRDAADRLFGRTTTLLAALTPAANGVDIERLHALLDSPVFATVSTLNRDGSPHQSVVWVARDEADLVFTVATGSAKERNLRRDPRVSVLVSPPTEPYTYAAVRGHATLRSDPTGELLDQLARKYTGRGRDEHHGDAADRQRDTPMTVVRMSPDRVAGRL